MVVKINYTIISEIINIALRLRWYLIWENRRGSVQKEKCLIITKDWNISFQLKYIIIIIIIFALFFVMLYLLVFIVLSTNCNIEQFVGK
jgi:hypothetical protein